MANTPEAIARWAEKTVKPAHKPKYSRVTDEQRIAILQLDKLGKTQVEIAQSLGIDQSTVSRWLSMCQDKTKEATAYLRGQSLRMARNIVETGRAADHIKALEGVNVLQPTATQPITWQIGIKADSVKLISATFASDTQALSTDLHSVSVETESDKRRLC